MPPCIECDCIVARIEVVPVSTRWNGLVGYDDCLTRKSGSVLRTTTSGAQTQDSYPAQGHMPFKLESVLDPFTGDGDFALWSREFDTVGEASRWNPRQKAQYLVLFMKGSAKDAARQALDEVEDEAENDRVYTHVVRRLGQAFSLKTGEAWRLLTTRSWRDEDTVDGVLAEFKRYLRVLGVTSTAASDILLKESVMKSLPAEVRRAVEAFEEDGKELSLNDVTAKARTLLKVLPKPTQQVAAAVTSGKYCYACKTTGHTAKECGQSGVQPRGPKKQDKASGVKRVKCFACHQRGHFARDFPTRSAAKQAAGAAHAEKDFPKARRSSDEAVLQILVFTHHEGCTDGRSAPVNGSDDVQQKDTEEKTSEEDKEVEHLEEEEAEVVQDDLSEKTKAWGLLLRIAILYVGQCPSDGNNLREVKNDWLKVKQDKDKTFETYAAEERQAYEKMQVMYQWSGVECPTEYERIIKFMKGLNSGLADAYSKKLRKQDRRAEELTYRSMVNDLSLLDHSMSLVFPWEKLDSAKNEKKSKSGSSGGVENSKSSTSPSPSAGVSQPSLSDDNRSSKQRHQ
ncbi:hypothetical protein FOZ60_002684 [Perkinsus olseni]|uniref:CCHC-type domain-containing protein n=1 Tax=Perkinsus olseni TaxID=32597 RepID=A0A7J6PK78_PEROL|nr:hypothetical protein FOZ60_002684 [Perkinsus olseni]